MNQENYPKVSFIIPVRNEEKFIEDCLQSLLSLDYPEEKVEILFAEGNSSDRTREILEDYAKKYDNIKIFDNSTGNTAVGRNICIEHATEEMLMDFSGHVIAPKNLLKVLALKLASQPENVVGIGCSNISPDNQNFIGKVSGVAFLGFMAGSGLFMQNTVFNKEKFVEHMAFTCYRKKIFEEIGKFDPNFWCGQDAEFDIRVKKAGYKILYTPETFVYHYKRDTIKDLFKQLYKYGIARTKMAKKYRGALRIFHLFPSLFVIGSLVLGILWLIDVVTTAFILFLILIYLVLCFISTAKISKNPFIIISSVFFYLLIKVSYGLGFIRGLFYSKQ
ncbi:MAG: glycosyltransferase [Candidatus Thermoplasmatota archaeon]|nr:glycosyltransferase [Candidatus Thermoplasmatota archaeon]